MTVTAAGASAGPSGLVGFATVHNDSSTRTARNVVVTMRALGANGSVMGTGSASVSSVSPQETVAVSASVAAPPGSAVNRVDGTARAQSSGAPNGATVSLSAGTASFLTDPYQPAITVAVTNASGAPLQADITAVCTDAGGTVRGGGDTVAQLANGTSSIRLTAVVSETPARCQGFVRVAEAHDTNR